MLAVPCELFSALTNPRLLNIFYASSPLFQGFFSSGPFFFKQWNFPKRPPTLRSKLHKPPRLLESGSPTPRTRRFNPEPFASWLCVVRSIPQRSLSTFFSFPVHVFLPKLLACIRRPVVLSLFLFQPSLGPSSPIPFSRASHPPRGRFFHSGSFFALQSKTLLQRLVIVILCLFPPTCFSCTG